jgi:hypothetical protein
MEAHLSSHKLSKPRQQQDDDSNDIALFSRIRIHTNYKDASRRWQIAVRAEIMVEHKISDHSSFMATCYCYNDHNVRLSSFSFPDFVYFICHPNKTHLNF